MSEGEPAGLLDDVRGVCRGLEALKNEHGSLLSAVELEDNLYDKDEDGIIDEQDVLLAQTKAACLSDSLNTLTSGLNDANLLMGVLQYISSLENDKGKLKAQVKRLADENNWLRQELQKTQQALQDAEVEWTKIKEEKEQLNYLLSLAKNDKGNNDSTIVVQANTDDDLLINEDQTLIKNEIVSDKDNNNGKKEHYEQLHQYAIQHMHQGRHEVAVSLCKKAIQELEQTHGKYHPERANMLNIMVVIYREQNKVKESVKLLLEVLEIRERINGHYHQSVASTLNNLSGLHGKLGEYKAAEQYCRKALEICQKLLGPSHTDVAQQLINLATLCQHLGKYEEVEWYYQRALEIYHTEYGSDHPQVIKTLNYLGKCYMKQGNLEAAETVFTKVRSAVQETNIGRESREQSSSPTELTTNPQPVSMGSTQLIKRSQSAGRLQGVALKQDRSPSIDLTTAQHQQVNSQH
jgi:kinesin light chain